MLSPPVLLASQTRDDVPFPTSTPQDVAQALHSTGYEFTPTRENGSFGKLNHAGVSVEFWMDSYSPVRESDPRPPVRGIGLFIELTFPQEIALVSNAGDSNLALPKIVPHLGKTASASLTIDLTKAPTYGQVRAALDGFWRTTDGYVRDHGGRFDATKPQDWTKAKFSNGYLLKVADETSLARATASWGWQYRKSVGGSTAGWLFPIDVDGTDVYVTEGHRDPEGFLTDTFFNIGSSVDLRDGIDAERWIATTGKRLKWAEFSSGVGGPHRVYPRVIFDLSQGITLGELKRRIKAFAVGLAALQKSPDAKKMEPSPQSPS